MRISRNFSQRELAHKLFLAPCTLSHYERGTRLVPTSVLVDAAKILNYEIKVFDLNTNAELNRIQIERITKN